VPQSDGWELDRSSGRIAPVFTGSTEIDWNSCTFSHFECRECGRQFTSRAALHVTLPPPPPAAALTAVDDDNTPHP
jgi:hypothetical protein